MDVTPLLETPRLIGDVPDPRVALLPLQDGDGLKVVGHGVGDLLFVVPFPDFHDSLIPGAKSRKGKEC